jgi:hypothetical protein
MLGIARPPDLRRWLGGHWIELAWLVFAVVNCVAMFVIPNLRTVPFFFIWISLTILYGFRLWPMGATLIVLATVISTNHEAFVTVDDGLKAFGTDRAFCPEAAHLPGTGYRFGGDELGYVDV